MQHARPIEAIDLELRPPLLPQISFFHPSSHFSFSPGQFTGCYVLAACLGILWEEPASLSPRSHSAPLETTILPILSRSRTRTPRTNGTLRPKQLLKPYTWLLLLFTWTATCRLGFALSSLSYFGQFVASPKDL